MYNELQKDKQLSQKRVYKMKKVILLVGDQDGVDIFTIGTFDDGNCQAKVNEHLQFNYGIEVDFSDTNRNMHTKLSNIDAYKIEFDLGDRGCLILIDVEQLDEIHEIELEFEPSCRSNHKYMVYINQVSEVGEETDNYDELEDCDLPVFELKIYV